MRKGRLITGIFAIALAIVILGTLAVACTTTTTVTAPGSAGATTTVTAAATTVTKTNATTVTVTPPAAGAKTYSWKFAGFMPPPDSMEITPTWWADQINKRTNGQVTLNLYHGEALAKQLDMPDALLGGVCDVATLSTSIAPKFPVSGVFDLPFLAPSQAAAMETFYFMIHQGLLHELDNYKVLWFQPTDPAFILFRTKKVTQISDMTGMKIRGLPGMRTDIPVSLGATGVSMTSAETYSALERGIIDGTSTTANFVINNKFAEVAKYALYMPFDTGGVVVGMNLNVWNSLPGDLKATIDELDEEARYYYATAVMKAPDQITKSLTDAGFVVYTLDAEQSQIYYTKPLPLIDKWIATLTSQGLGDQAKKAVDLARWVYAVQTQKSGQ